MKILALDGMNYCYKYYHRLKHLESSTGEKTGMIMGFLKFVQSLKYKNKDAEVYILWDTKCQFRYDLYPAYKQHRKDKRDSEEYQEIINGVKILKEIFNA